MNQLNKLANGSKAERRAALDSLRKPLPVLVSATGEVLATYVPKAGQAPALCIIDDL